MEPLFALKMIKIRPRPGITISSSKDIKIQASSCRYLIFHSLWRTWWCGAIKNISSWSDYIDCVCLCHHEKQALKLWACCILVCTGQQLQTWKIFTGGKAIAKIQLEVSSSTLYWHFQMICFRFTFLSIPATPSQNKIPWQLWSWQNAVKDCSVSQNRCPAPVYNMVQTLT